MSFENQFERDPHPQPNKELGTAFADEQLARVQEMERLLQQFQVTNDVKADTLRFLEISALHATGWAQGARDLILSGERTPAWVLEAHMKANIEMQQHGTAQVQTPGRRYYHEVVAPLENAVIERIQALINGH